ARNAAAQSPMPTNTEPSASAAPAVSTEAVVASSGAAVDVVASTGGVKIETGVKPKLARPLHAVIHAEAKEWEPVALKAGGDPFQAETKAVLREEKVKGKYKGTSSKATASARLHKDGKYDRWLVVSIFPKELERRRMHIEARFRIVEGFVEEAKAELVSITDRRQSGAGLDTFELRERGVEFGEASPASGTLLISALDPRPSASALNAGALKLAAFDNALVGLADVSWSVKGLLPPK
ncbi:MAG: hypothetical protein ACHQ2Z_08465, partial [Elusimicrobiota bacterium]